MFCSEMLQGNLQAQSYECGTSGTPRESRLIKLRKMEIGGELRDVAVRLVESNGKIDAACDLINDRYVRKGYGGGHRIPSTAHHMTFTAEVDDEVIGTITLAVDSENGLAIDKTFKQEVDEFRVWPDSKICELVKFAFAPNIHSKELMASLFHIVFVYGHRTYGCTDLFIEVHPRHVRFYEATLGFQKLGSRKVNASVGASLQLMWLKVADIRKYINQTADAADPIKKHSLYSLFFSPKEESGIYERLHRAEKQTSQPELRPEYA